MRAWYVCVSGLLQHDQEEQRISTQVNDCINIQTSYIYIYISTDKAACMHACTYIHARSRTYSCIHPSSHAHNYHYTPTHTHTHTSMYQRTCITVLSLMRHAPHACNPAVFSAIFLRHRVTLVLTLGCVCSANARLHKSPMHVSASMQASLPRSLIVMVLRQPVANRVISRSVCVRRVASRAGSDTYVDAVYMYGYICMYVCVYAYVCMYGYMHVHMYMHAKWSHASMQWKHLHICITTCGAYIHT